MEIFVFILADKTPQGEHERRFNAPTTMEVAVILAVEQRGARDIVLEERSGTLKRIRNMYRSYIVLQYPLLFWQGGRWISFRITTKKLSYGNTANQEDFSYGFLHLQDYDAFVEFRRFTEKQRPLLTVYSRHVCKN